MNHTNERAVPLQVFFFWLLLLLLFWRMAVCDAVCVICWSVCCTHWTKSEGQKGVIVNNRKQTYHNVIQMSVQNFDLRGSNCLFGSSFPARLLPEWCRLMWWTGQSGRGEPTRPADLEFFRSRGTLVGSVAFRGHIWTDLIGFWTSALIRRWRRRETGRWCSRSQWVKTRYKRGTAEITEDVEDEIKEVSSNSPVGDNLSFAPDKSVSRVHALAGKTRTLDTDDSASEFSFLP